MSNVEFYPLSKTKTVICLQNQYKNKTWLYYTDIKYPPSFLNNTGKRKIFENTSIFKQQRQWMTINYDQGKYHITFIYISIIIDIFYLSFSWQFKQYLFTGKLMTSKQPIPVLHLWAIWLNIVFALSQVISGFFKLSLSQMINIMPMPQLPFVLRSKHVSNSW